MNILRLLADLIEYKEIKIIYLNHLRPPGYELIGIPNNFVNHKLLHPLTIDNQVIQNIIPLT